MHDTTPGGDLKSQWRREEEMTLTFISSWLVNGSDCVFVPMHSVVISLFYLDRLCEILFPIVICGAK